jgi:hypothetical protein
MATITADIAIKSANSEKDKATRRIDLSLAMHLAACRFASPAGVAFLPQNYLPFLLPGKG